MIQHYGKILLFGMLLFTGALYIRLYRIAEIPAGFFADEAAIGYNAYTLAAKGTDEYGIPYPFFFRSFGDYRNPVPIYLNIPSVALFGLNEFSVRFTAAFSGSLTVVLVFFLFLEAKVWKKPRQNILCAGLAALLLMLSPWHIHFSRFGSEYIYFPFFLTFGWFLFLKGIHHRWVLPISFFLFGVTLYTYYPAWLVTPLLVAALCILYKKQLRERTGISLLSIGIFCLCMIPLYRGIRSGQALTRWDQVNMAKSGNRSLPFQFVKNYISHFSPLFLFTKGDIDYPGHFIRRFSSRGAGEVHLYLLPFIAIGLGVALVLRTPFLVSIVTILALYPLGGSVTTIDGGPPFAFRSVLGVLPFPLLAAIGITATCECIKRLQHRVVFGSILICLVLVSYIPYYGEYLHQYPLYSSDFWGWQFGPRDAMAYFLSHRSEYDEMYLMGEFNSPEIFIPFYDPKNTCKGKCRVGSMENLDTRKRQLFAVSVQRFKEIPKGLPYIVRYTLVFPNGDLAFAFISVPK